MGILYNSGNSLSGLRLGFATGSADARATTVATVCGVPAEEQLRRNVLELMKMWKMNQATLAARLRKSQPWVSRRLKPPAEPDTEDPTGTRFQFSDLDALGAVFGLSPAELLQPMHGKWDRRSGRERRTGIDRRGSRITPPVREGPYFYQQGPSEDASAADDPLGE